MTDTQLDPAARADHLRARIDHHTTAAETLLELAAERAEHGWPKDDVANDTGRAFAHAALAEVMTAQLERLLVAWGY